LDQAVISIPYLLGGNPLFKISQIRPDLGICIGYGLYSNLGFCRVAFQHPIADGKANLV